MTSKFLFYSWLDLKSNKSFFSSIFISKRMRPLRKDWFKKASFLICKSQFIYKKNLNINSLFFLKNKIIENAFLIFVHNILQSKNFDFSSSLTECVRKLIQFYFNVQIFPYLLINIYCNKPGKKFIITKFPTSII
jgi:hypothetical protein